ncbi:UDP-N-acetylglucosamine 1-carboxyvinyltransferase 1 [Pelotomaculum schinkii]|uniref:UDP-N-acetylglucosamine 1-carboxyvinyltransferase n=1 Tax=Pelotomaculum schinkii TaxID=78350 RepID=A0A4Y7R5V4_9FIRM|nr:UDP-N-acetylglucosamine 1-carboxyvinyltransferase [Pelotomaculum schinkii]TEB04237.1 UDP-N-acetylglucosamine 1-carboxyvinyltransferase 1 [Pelotomaculum schinkii]
MEKLIVRGGASLRGTVKVSGAKNAVLPIIAASLLSECACTLQDIPNLADVASICRVIEKLGARVCRGDKEINISVPDLKQVEAPYEYVRLMRASFLVMGPLLARAGRAVMPLPGGCAIGTRPIDLHLKGFKALGAKIIYGHGCIEAVAERLKGSQIYLDFPSVGATENLIMAASLARGATVIENAAEEPEIVDLVNFLNAMGARIKGAGTKIIRVEGVPRLSGTVHTVIPDRIEAGTFLTAVAITGGDVLVDNVICDHLKPVTAKLREAGVRVEENENSIRVSSDSELQPVDIKTMPYPGFPTDMQAQLMAVLCLARGTSMITETVFENRFMHANELKRMGARIKIEGRTAVVQGVPRLTGAPVKATDLRAGAALVLAGLAAEGRTEIGNIFHIDRGYDRLEEKLRGLGADIQRSAVVS